MIKWISKSIKEKLTLVLLIFLLFTCSSTQAQKTQQVSVTASPNSTLITSTNTSANITETSFPSSASVIPSVVTAEEITRREQQVKIAIEFERKAQRDEQAGVGTRTDTYKATYFRLTNEIQLLQAKQFLKQQDKQSSVANK
ncbi:hypothetical protein DSM106972_027110 [Dulcicalothrix desertica PCC 7102]|uniref:DUF4168 domain-containing protein n=1 Tax=Dulcicalothrix desertica PCC 7102 TaxID=232991 RepID=A0A433VK19_9CYAN|nr:hypothetical protein [Dulcicalothrix desertica]RUT06454.1 hypothetical protein DSM106972_027110 [Dulcicalothrix desertica PCC 7102]TWH62654.1 hypothetical protein CAL7102_00156 [Dulcicalothrix desertica PCC 7102]